MTFNYDWPRANITTDVIYKHPHHGILLIRRKNFPDAGKFACPGGHLEINERLVDCARREFSEEVGFSPQNTFELIGVFDKIGRDPRDRYLTFVYAVDWRFGDEAPQAGDDAAECKYFSLDSIRHADLAIDHHEIIMNALFGSFKESNALQCKK
jgi:8-oxo-dGTP diphosphatase